MATYELWETLSGNLMGSYATEPDALAVVAKAVRAHGADYLDTIVLVEVNRRGDSTPLAQGDELFRRAEAASPGRRAASA